MLSQIRTGLPEEMQSTVDGYEKMLADALAGLTLVEERNVNYVDNAKLTATASSHQDNGSAPDKALDGDTKHNLAFKVGYHNYAPLDRS